MRQIGLLSLLVFTMACCPVEDIVTLDIELTGSFFKNYSSSTFEEISELGNVSYLDYTITTETVANGFYDFDPPNRRFLQSPDCDTSDPEYNFIDPVVLISIQPMQDYNNDYPADSDMTDAFYSVFLNTNPLRPAPEILVHGESISIEAFNPYFINYHDIIELRGQEPINQFGMKPKIAPAEAGNYSFSVTLHLLSGTTVQSNTQLVNITP